MKLVIDIPEEQYNTIKSDLYNTFSAEMKIWGLEAIRNGIPLDSISTISVGVDGKVVQIYPNNAVFDKIRAEIETLNPFDYGYHRNDMLDMVLSVIDKCKAESEDKE